jgi:hypothetical protein
VTDALPVKVVPSEAEAEIACALLRASGIKCNYREPNVAAQSFWGWREILVGECDLESARQLLAGAPPAD